MTNVHEIKLPVQLHPEGPFAPLHVLCGGMIHKIIDADGDHVCNVIAEEGDTYESFYDRAVFICDCFNYYFDVTGHETIDRACIGPIKNRS